MTDLIFTDADLITMDSAIQDSFALMEEHGISHTSRDYVALKHLSVRVARNLRWRGWEKQHRLIWKKVVGDE